MIGRRNYDGIDLAVVEQLSEIRITAARAANWFAAFRGSSSVGVTDGDDVGVGLLDKIEHMPLAD